jgi:hypothetical protein
MSKLNSLCALLVALSVIGIGQPTFAETRSPIVVPPGAPIPKDFKTWSLFLVCNPAWLGDDTASKMRMTALHSAFLGFGGSLGTQNAAIWFTKAGGSPTDYDSDRAGDYCQTYGLKSNRSPYIIVSSDYPTASGAPGDFVAVSLVGLDTDNVLTLLGQLSDKVKASQLNPDTIGSDRYWRGWVQILEDTAAVLGKLAKGLSFSVNTRFVKVNYDAKAVAQ